MRHLILAFVLVVLVIPTVARAQQVPESAALTPAPAPPAATPATTADQQPAGAPPPQTAVEYSRGYEIRRKVHVYASFATVPLFATEIVLGQKLYDGNASSGVRSAHGAVAGGIAALFGVNTITGVWNLWEARKDPHSRGKRIVHALLMLGADAGFAATGMVAPDDDEGRGNRSLHRNVALTSIGIATASYVVMLVNR